MWAVGRISASRGLNIPPILTSVARYLSTTDGLSSADFMLVFACLHSYVKPILNPCSIPSILDYSLSGWCSRSLLHSACTSGVWIPLRHAAGSGSLSDMQRGLDPSQTCSGVWIPLRHAAGSGSLSDMQRGLDPSQTCSGVWIPRCTW